MRRLFGFDLLVEQVADAVAGELSQIFAGMQIPRSRCGDSPIEILLHAALWARTEYSIDQEWPWKLERASATASLEIINPSTPGFSNRLIMQLQTKLAGIGRVDFLFHAYGDCWVPVSNGGLPGWRKLIVECDGHDFHERTKAQAAKDRSRDRAACLGGIEVLRFTGSELWNDPWKCAGQIIEWANRAV
jgi:hypothetical protein